MPAGWLALVALYFALPAVLTIRMGQVLIGMAFFQSTVEITFAVNDFVEHGESPSGPALFDERLDHVILGVLPRNASSIPVRNVVEIASIFTAPIRTVPVSTNNHKGQAL